MQDLSKLHIAIIMDGNGRWAKKRAMPRVMGHKRGVDTVKKIIRHACERDVGYLSLFAFSAENWLRPKEEVSFLMNLLDEYIEGEWNEIVNNNIIFRLSGRVELLPEGIKNKLLKLIEATKENSGTVLNMALSYSWNEELVDAIQSIARDVASNRLNPENIDIETVRSRFYNADIPDIDLLIRTSGEKRISNFMLGRLTYSELYYTDTLWPDFDEANFDSALDDFFTRKRRFGLTDEQI